MATTASLRINPQFSMFATVDMADFAAGANSVLTLPTGAVVTSGFIAVTTGYSAACTLDIGDGTTANRFANDVDAEVAALTAFTLDGIALTSGLRTIKVTPSAVDASSPAGVFNIGVTFCLPGVNSYTRVRS